MKAIIHAKAVLPGGILENAVILTEGEIIRAVGTELPVPAGAEVIDAQNLWVGPGFVDIHNHGSGAENKVWAQDPETVSRYHLRHGTTTMCAYLGYDQDRETLLRTTEKLQSALDRGLAPNVYGIGFEGPYVNPSQGANVDRNDRRMPDPEEYTRLYEACHGRVMQWMYAPERDEDGFFAAFLREKRIPTAIGHSNASPAQVRRAVDRGATIVTHLFDAMGCWLGPESIHLTGIIQDSMPVGCLICPELTYELIPDSLGMHVKPANLKLVYQMAGPRRIAIITDCTSRNYDPADYPDDPHRSVTDLNFNEKGELSGSALTMDQAFRNFMRHTGAPVTDLFEMTATTPARVTGIDHLTGSIVPGKYADLVMLDPDFRVKGVFLRGSRVV